MKVVILAGGFGTRLEEETVVKPKPMVEIGGRPILWHIMKIYSHYGLRDFVICLGYKGYIIKEYFANYLLHESDMVIDLKTKEKTILRGQTEDWRITLVDTGMQSLTGDRIKKIQSHVGNETFCLTYGDGVADVPVDKLVEFHRSKKKLMTVTAVTPPSRFGALTIENDIVTSFEEKPVGESAMINGGFFVLEPGIFNYLKGENIIWERGPMEGLARDGQMAAYQHTGFWQPMDTLRDRNHLESLWKSGHAPWCVWR